MIPPNSQSDALIAGHDAVATISAICEQPINRKQIKDAKNLLPLLTAKPKAQGHTILLHQSKPGNKGAYAIQEGPWKLIMTASNHKSIQDLTPTSLFNLSTNEKRKRRPQSYQKP